MTDDTRAQALAELQRLGQEHDAAGGWGLGADGDICAADGRLVACPCYDEDVWPIEEARRNARRLASVDDLEEALADVLAHLVAATSLARRGGIKAAPSDTMGRMMIEDYKRAVERGQAALAKVRGEQG